MIEVNLYSISSGNLSATVGRCVDRTRFNKEALGVGVMDFVKGFLKTNMQYIEPALKNIDVLNFINGTRTMRTKDFMSINYYLAKAGFMVQIQNVTEDEENPTSIPEDTTEWNIIDYTFMQEGYPTTIKVIPTDGMDIAQVLRKIVDDSSFFDSDILGGIKNPLDELLTKIEKVKDLKGSIDPGMTTKLYEILDQLGIKIFVATSE